MNRRNWLSLARKLIDQYDMDYTVSSMQTALGQATLSYWGEGVLQTTTYPTPFPIALSGVNLGGTVGTGIGIDPNGQIVEIDSFPDVSAAFVCDAADSVNPRWDLLCISYQMVADTPIPLPSNPINSTNLNLHDDFLITVVKGTASATPSYPTKAAGQIILAGLRIPAGATLGSQITVDLGIREVALQRIFENPSFIHEVPAGSGTAFTLSQAPINSNSLLLFVDGVTLQHSDFTLSGTGITLATALATGQTIDAWYIYDNPSSLNPLSGFSETPVNTGDNLTFSLTGRTGNKSSTLVFIDGAPLPLSQYSVVQGISSDQIVLATPLATGQDIFVFYLVNPASLGMGGGGGGGGGTVTGAANIGTGFGLYSMNAAGVLQFFSIKAGTNVAIAPDGLGAYVISSTASGGGGGYVAQGSESAPITVNPSAGITPTSDLLQVWYVQGQSGMGAQPVTAAKPIADGAAIGQVVKIVIVNNSDYPVFQQGANTDPNQNGDWPPMEGPIQYASIQYNWTGLRWSEDFRR